MYSNIPGPIKFITIKETFFLHLQININNMSRFKLTIEYEGTRYSGWQMQKGGKTIQGEILEACRELLKQMRLIFSEQDVLMEVFMLQDRLHTWMWKRIWFL